MIQSGNAALVHGSMRVLTEFVGEVGDQHMPPVIETLFPELLRVFTAPLGTFGVRTRGRVVHIVGKCLEMVHIMSEEYTDSVDGLVMRFVPQWMQVGLCPLDRTRTKGPSDLTHPNRIYF